MRITLAEEAFHMNRSQACTVIVGAGPGLGAALADRFAGEGHAVALLARSPRHREPIVRRIRACGGHAQSYDCDAGDPASVAAAFEQVRGSLGDPEVLIYNAGVFTTGGLLELSPETFEGAWRVNCFGGFLAAREVMPAMLKQQRGTVLFTGATASLRGGARFAGLAVGKFGLRALAQSLARELGPKGIHVAHVIIDGQIASPAAPGRDPRRPVDSLLQPKAIAEAYWQIHAQQRSAWTLEQDLRPYAERF
jgi:NAD(P)-dependent dehydrogenase (short-subunit alcohol dehydrogenase family)